MRLSQTFGLVTIAALVATALISASTAQAEGSTALCKTPEIPCQSKNLYPQETILEVKSVNPLILTSKFTIECAESNMSLVTTQALASPMKISVKSLGFNKCKLGALECTVTAKNLGTMFLLNLEKFLGTAEVGALSLKVTCPSFGECTIGAPAVTLDARSTQGETAAELRGPELTYEREAGACLEIWRFDVLNTIKSPAPLYISS